MKKKMLTERERKLSERKEEEELQEPSVTE